MGTRWSTSNLIVAAYNGETRDVPPVWFLAHQSGSWWLAIPFTLVTIILALNVYYRLLVYVACVVGPLLFFAGILLLVATH